MMRLTVSGASTVCSVESTRWPVSAAHSAVWTVSSSRISPTRITSGSWRSTRRSARLKDAVSCPTSRWLMMQLRSRCRNSIGSSIVTMCFCIVRFMWSIIAASVVDLPEPVVPVSRMIPRCSLASLVTASGSPSSSTDLIDDRDRAHDDRDRSALQEGVDAEAPEALHGVGEVDLVLSLELGDLLGVQQHLRQRLARVLREQPLGAGDRLEVAVEADQRIRGDLEVKVGALGRDQVPQRVIEIESHVEKASARSCEP